MVKKLKIKNFKGLSELNVNDLSCVNLIGGRNNVGKTSLLEALFLFHDRANPHMFLRLHGFRGVLSVGLTPEAMWAPIFTSYDLKHPIEISVESTNGENNKLILQINNKYIRQNIQGYTSFGQRPQIKTDINPPPSIALDITYKNGHKKDQTAHLLIESGSIGMHIDFMDFKPVETIFMAATSRIGPQEDAVRFGKLDIKGELDEIINFIKETIEPRLLNLSSIALEDQSVIHAQLEGISRKIPVSYMGDGMARLISIILAISNCENGSILIDEIENGIHYSVIPKIWKGILKASQKYNCQVFATTHSYECLESAIKGIDENSHDKFRYIRLERDNDKLISNTYLFEELSASIAHGWEVR